jgi:tRNA dimethylallyltransferase
MSSKYSGILFPAIIMPQKESPLPATIIAIQGQTASGKSRLAIDLAHRLKDVWIISADSRQVYKGFDLGTGKITGSWDTTNWYGTNMSCFMSEGVPHMLIDYADPAKDYSLAQYIADFTDLVTTVKLPKYLIICGGTGMYVDALLSRYVIQPTSPVSQKLRHKYEQFSQQKLQDAVDSHHIVLNTSDYQNPRRLINALIRKELDNTISNHKKPLQAPLFSQYYNFAVEREQTKLQTRIYDRLHDRINAGMITEIQSFQHLGTRKMLDFGLEYRLTTLYLLGQLTYDRYIHELTKKTIQYSKRQLTWLKKHSPIWIKNLEEITAFLEQA